MIGWRREPDANLRRFERNQVVACAAMAGIAAGVGRFAVAAGVIGGGVLVAIGYGAIKSAVDMLMPASGAVNPKTEARRSGRRAFWIVVKFVSRYALLALAAYVMLVRLHVHPVGLLLGVSAPVLSAAFELVGTRRSLRAGHPR